MQDTVTSFVRENVSVSQLICRYRDQLASDLSFENSVINTHATTDASAVTPLRGTSTDDPSAMEIDHTEEDNIDTSLSSNKDQNNATVDEAAGYFDQTQDWLNHRDHSVECFVCRQPVLSTEKIISTGCACRLNARRPMHTTCMVQLMEFGLQCKSDPSKGTAPGFVHQCGHCLTPFLGKSQEVFDRSRNRYNRFLGLAQEAQKDVWVDELIEVLKDLESVVWSIWKNWRHNGYNPYLAFVLGRLSVVNIHVTTLAPVAANLNSIPSRLSLCCFLLAYDQIGPSSIFELGGVEWILNRSKTFTEANTQVITDTKIDVFARYVMPRVAAYLIVIMRHAKDLSLRFQTQQLYVQMINQTKDSDLLCYLLHKLTDFLMACNMLGGTFDIELPVMHVCQEMVICVLSHKLGGHSLEHKLVCQDVVTHNLLTKQRANKGSSQVDVSRMGEYFVQIQLQKNLWGKKRLSFCQKQLEVDGKNTLH